MTLINLFIIIINYQLVNYERCFQRHLSNHKFMITTLNQEGKFPLTQLVNSVYPVANTDNEQLAIYYVF